MLRRANTFNNVRECFESALKQNRLYTILRQKLSSVPRNLKSQSSNVLRLWAHQCECVLAQRIRRGQQMFTLYTKLWEETALREFVVQMRRRIGGKSKDFLMGALGVAIFDWKNCRISDGEIRKHANELKYVYTLKEKTICDKCDKNSRICPCQTGTGADQEKKPKLSTYDDWKVFIEKNDLIVWRRLHSSGNYEYKVYGSYNDVSAEDFLNVQIDIDYRRQWDKTAVVLNIVEADPEIGSNSDILYWEMQWPKLFANRDYVFNRRFLVDHNSKLLYLVSKSTKHPSVPKEQTKYRIEDYWSYMVIKPYTELNKPGIEFSLTYYDNPGVNIPASVTTWVAMKAMPDFLERLREASKKYRVYCQKEGVCRICNIMDFQKAENQWDFLDEDIITDNTVYEANFKIVKKTSSKAVEDEPSEEKKSEEKTPVIEETTAGPETQNIWRYFHLNSYFS